MPSDETQFEPGQSGNPAGRPKGSRSRATQALERILDEDAESILRKVIELAQDGDATAMRLCLDRMMPARKDRTIAFDLPEIKTAADLTKATRALMQGVANGEITPSEAAELSKVVDAHMKAITITEIADRLTAVEKNKGGKR